MGGWHAHVKLGEKVAAHEMQKTLLREEKQEVTILDSRHTEWWRREMSQEALEETGVPFPDGGRALHPVLQVGLFTCLVLPLRETVALGEATSGDEEKKRLLCRTRTSLFSTLEPPPTPRLCFYLHLQCLCVFHFGFMTEKA